MLEMEINTNDDNLDLNIESQDETLETNIEINTTLGTYNYKELKNKPSINGVELVGNKTTEELGIVGTSMTEIELSTDIGNPTNIFDYINASGTYVAKNKGVLGYNREPITVLGKGQFFKVLNLKDLYSIIGEELPDEDNLIRLDLPMTEGINKILFISGNGEISEGDEINSLNINDYVSIDTSNLLTINMVNSSFGIKLNGNNLAIQQALNAEIDSGNNVYKSITPNNIDYAVKTKGNKYFADKKSVDDLNNDLTTLKTEIETILDSVVSV